MNMSSFFYQVLQVMGHQWNEIDRGKPTTRRKTCPSATLSTTNPTWTDPGSKPGLRSGRPATNRLSHDTAILTLTCRIRLLSSSFVLKDSSVSKAESFPFLGERMEFGPKKILLPMISHWSSYWAFRSKW
jgi:hypothetical protein